MSKANKASKVLRTGLNRFTASLEANGGKLCAAFYGDMATAPNGAKVPLHCARGAFTNGLSDPQTEAQKDAQCYLGVAMFEKGGHRRASVRKRVHIKPGANVEDMQLDFTNEADRSEAEVLGHFIPAMHDSHEMTPEESIESFKPAIIRAEADEAEGRLTKRGL